MKTEIRKITVEQEVYIAEDGKEFEDADECEGYEMSILANRLDMYTHRCVKTNSVTNCWYVKLNTEDEASMFKRLCDFDGVSCKGIDKVGTYMYTEGGYGYGNEAWTNLSEIIKSLEESEDTE